MEVPINRFAAIIAVVKFDVTALPVFVAHYQALDGSPSARNPSRR